MYQRGHALSVHSLSRRAVFAGLVARTAAVGRSRYPFALLDILSGRVDCHLVAAAARIRAALIGRDKVGYPRRELVAEIVVTAVFVLYIERGLAQPLIRPVFSELRFQLSERDQPVVVYKRLYRGESVDRRAERAYDKRGRVQLRAVEVGVARGLEAVSYSRRQHRRGVDLAEPQLHFIAELYAPLE